MLLNLSNHPASKWSDKQRQTAIDAYASIRDLPFPHIDPQWSGRQVDELASEYLHLICEMNPTTVHIMGEMTFCFKLITMLKTTDIPCIASTTARTTTIDDSGNKISVFDFVGFRLY